MKNSVLSWMKQHERRHQMQFNAPSPQKNHSRMKKAKTVEKSGRDPQKKLDKFLRGQNHSSLFDDHFSHRDFQNVTQQWKKKNLEELATN
jgi:hypothetical protein